MSKIIKISDAAGIASGMADSLDSAEKQQTDFISSQNNPSQPPTELSNETSYEMKDELSDEQKIVADNLSASKLYTDVMATLNKDPATKQQILGLLAGTDWDDVTQQAQSLNYNTLLQQAKELGIQNVDQAMLRSTNIAASRKRIFDEIQRIKSNTQQYPAPQRRNVAFNLRNYKLAQVAQIPQKTKFSGPDDFCKQYVDRLLQWRGKKGDPGTEDAIDAANEIINLTDDNIIGDELRDDLISIMQSEMRDEACQKLRILFEKLSSPSMRTEAGRKKMGISGIIKYNLSDHVLNNKQAQNNGMIKTAAEQFGMQYMLYGPSEKRICPKLRGKGGGQAGSGDVVSEYICRHHCLDGIVIDDNKTVCGEALWRANVMDKFSRDYVDADGRPQGGYIEKRFEVNHYVPEESRMRLKPGEIRKERPVELYGNLEARMQAMRKAKGEDRGYRPETDTGDTFNWTKDIDQNNVEVTQAERDRREESMGHTLVQYENKDKQENNPKMPKTASKKSFNLKEYKSAQTHGVPSVPFEDEEYWMGTEDNDLDEITALKDRLMSARSPEEVQQIQNEAYKLSPNEMSFSALEGLHNLINRKLKEVAQVLPGVISNKPQNINPHTGNPNESLYEENQSGLERRNPNPQGLSSFLSNKEPTKIAAMGFNLKQHKEAESKKKS